MSAKATIIGDERRALNRHIINYDVLKWDAWLSYRVLRYGNHVTATLINAVIASHKTM